MKKCNREKIKTVYLESSSSKYRIGTRAMGVDIQHSRIYIK
jgi:hypothetical protein